MNFDGHPGPVLGSSDGSDLNPPVRERERERASKPLCFRSPPATWIHRYHSKLSNVFAVYFKTYPGGSCGGPGGAMPCLFAEGVGLVWCGAGVLVVLWCGAGGAVCLPAIDWVFTSDCHTSVDLNFRGEVDVC
jgi:hypothetical protein